MVNEEIVELAGAVYRNRYFTCKEGISGTQQGCKLADVLVLRGQGIETTVLREDFFRHVDEFNNPPKRKSKYES